MICIDCGQPAEMVTNLSDFLDFGFCRKCAKKRIKSKLPFLGKQMNVDDLWDDLHSKDLNEIKE